MMARVDGVGFVGTKIFSPISGVEAVNPEGA
jgi:hypothetical protein